VEELLSLFNTELLYPFLLLFTRVLAFFVFMPIYNHIAIPANIKAVFAFYMTLFLFPALNITKTYSDREFVEGMLSELILVLSVSILMQITFAAFRIAGELISYASALSMATMFDPTSGAQDSLFSRFFNILSIFIFFQTGIYQVMLLGLYDSMSSVELGRFIIFEYDGIKIMAKEITLMMQFAMSIALPLFFTALIVDVFLGYSVRSMPQFSIFVVTFQLKFMLIFIFLVYILSIIIDRFKEHILHLMY
jgi:flagellar biosynthetic protein FliR